MISQGFARMATVTASTTRVGAVVAGLTPAPAVNLATLKCLPLDPLDPEIAASIGLEAFRELLQTMCENDLDILPGDELVTGGVTYKVRAVEEWTWRPAATDTLLVILEELM